MDYTVHGILQARILEWVASPISRGSSQPRDQTQVSGIAGGFFTSWAGYFIVKQQKKIFLNSKKTTFLRLQRLEYLHCLNYHTAIDPGIM